MISLNKQSLKQWQDENLEHLRYEYDLKKGDIVLDIGAYVGEFATVLRQTKSCEVTCFDPHFLPSSSADPRIKLVHAAAWTHDGVIKMGGAFYYTSMFDENGVQEFKCVDIAPFLQKEVALLKINCEGGEYQILDYIISKGLQRNIKNIQVQFHMIDNFAWQAYYDDVSSKLNQTHELTWRYPFCWENWKLK